MSTLLIADDHRLFADGMQFIIQYATDHQVVGVVNNGNDVMPFLQKQSIDVLLLDVDLPGKSGQEVAREVRTHYPMVQILAISMLNDYDSIQTMFEAGATGYCLKSAGKELLLEALHAVCNRERYVSPELIDIMFIGQKCAVKHPHCHLNELTAREKEVLKAFTSGKSLSVIADELFLSKHTVESHRKNIYSKLYVHSINELMAFMAKNGLKG